jgi:hypothetical protein
MVTQILEIKNMLYNSNKYGPIGPTGKNVCNNI